MTNGAIDNCMQSRLPRFYLLNPTSLAKASAKEQLFADVQSVKADIVLIDETWFTCKHSITELNLSGFALYRRYRNGRKGAAYVHMCGTIFHVRIFIQIQFILLEKWKLCG